MNLNIASKVFYVIEILSQCILKCPFNKPKTHNVSFRLTGRELHSVNHMSDTTLTHQSKIKYKMGGEQHINQDGRVSVHVHSLNNTMSHTPFGFQPEHIMYNWLSSTLLSEERWQIKGTQELI